MQQADVFVFTPVPRINPAIAIAACRAGARGTLDLEYAADIESIREAIAKLSRFTDRPFGVKLGVRGGSILESLLANPTPGLGWIVLAGGDHAELSNWIEQLRAARLEVLFEATDVTEMRRGAELGVDGLILKGHEAGGRVGEETSFILIQRWFSQVARELADPPPVWVQGGIGLNTAAACVVAGARGVVLDSQVLLSREANWSDATRNWLRSFDGSQTGLFGNVRGQRIRIAQWPKSPLGAKLASEAQRIEGEITDPLAGRLAWHTAVADAFHADSMLELRSLGQDATSAAPLADKFRTVGGIVAAIVEGVQKNLKLARDLKPLAEGSPLAVSHKTRYPIVQGPMTRVSDTAAFCDSVARAGGLPFLALALLRKAEVDALLVETQKRLGDLSWGAGILGFLPAEIRQEQTACILARKPPFVLIAGGRPDQAKEFEEQGIPTYLHVPSPGLLRMFLKDGARRFILEGRECGGHVGPRTSFALWDAAVEVILEHLGANGTDDKLHVVFAGGIHDELSGAMVAAAAARLAERKVKVGVLMGTAYLFTREAVADAAIVERFQQEALRCDDTVLLETGTGHAIRCVPTPYCDSFLVEKRKLEAEGRSAEEITRKLEWMNIGRLRVASKGVDRAEGSAPLAPVAEQEQYDRGMYMIGQLSSLRNEITTIAELHETVCGGATRRLATQTDPPKRPATAEGPCDVAVIGVSCFYPGAGNLQQYWSNILKKVYSVTEVPETHWNWKTYYDENPLAKDRICSKWGGFLGDVSFDPFKYGISPAAMKVIEPLQFLVLEAVQHALLDAGYADRPFARERTAAVCGIGGGGGPQATFYGFRACMPLVDSVPGFPMTSQQIIDLCEPLLPDWTEDSFPGFLMNVAVGRVSNRNDLGGPNYAVDAACASSLAALQLAVRELQTGASDVALALGADTVQTPYAYMAFTKTFALSRLGRIRPFDAKADGIVLSEGVGVLVLKRLADAERDGDRILSVIRGIGASSDGRDKGLTAPNAAGQVRALERAYAQARISPRRLELVEAHGTGTVVGDRTEAEALGTFMRQAGAQPANCAMGSVKSMIGHAKCAAGIAGVIKTTLALHHKVLPPTICENPNPNGGFSGGPLYLNTEARPWVHGGPEPRCAGVSAFGFGGTNFHVVMEEYTDDFVNPPAPFQRAWDAELIICRQPTRERLLSVMQQVQQGLARGGQARLVDLAAAIARGNSTDPAHPVLAIVATSVEELREKLPLAMQALRGTDAVKVDPRGVYFAAAPAKNAGGLAFLFPGQGSQYPNMLADVAMAFPAARETLDAAAGALTDRLPRPLGRYIYPPSTFDEASQRLRAEELAQSNIAQSALAATEMAMFRVLRRMGARPQFLAGHSSGEYVALAAAGCLSPQDLVRVAERRGALMIEAGKQSAGAMAAVSASAKQTQDALRSLPGVTLANLNSPTQTVISGARDVLEKAIEQLKAAGLTARLLPVSGAFHSPHVAAAGAQLADELRKLDWRSPTAPVYSNLTAAPHSGEPRQIIEQLAQHVASPVRFIEEIEAMYAAGARVFIEVGPQGVLTGLVKQILGDRPHVALATDLKGRPGVVQLAHTLAQMLIHGAPLDAKAWFDQRVTTPFDLADLEKQSLEPPRSPNSWVINGIRARPMNAPEPMLLGQTLNKERWEAASANPKVTSRPLQSPGAATNGSPSKPNAPSSTPAKITETGLTATAPAIAVPAAMAPTAAAPGAAALNRPAPSPGIEPLTPEVSVPMHSPSNNGDYRPDPQPAPLSAAPDGAVDEATLVMCRYQDLMAKFLDSQQAVLRDYFQLVSGAPIGPSHGFASEPLTALPTQARAVTAPQTHASHEPAALPHTQPAQQTLAPAPSAHVASVPAQATNGEAHAEGAAGALATQNGEGATAKTPGTQIVVTREEMTKRLLDLVCKRTGYPLEMLDLDLDLEADLGVDSIKRVEILGTLAESLGGKESDLGGRIEIEKLTVLRTLRGILDYLDEAALGGQQAATAGGKASVSTNGEGHHVALPSPAQKSSGTNGHAVGSNGDSNGHDTGELKVQRGVIELIDVPIASSTQMSIPADAILITDDGRGVASQLAQRLADFGQKVACLRWGTDGVRQTREDLFEANLSDPRQVTELVELLRTKLGAIGALIHLTPLAELVADEPAERRAERDVKSLYLLARSLEEDLNRAAAAGSAALLGAMSLGGALGFEEGPLSSHYRPAHGGVAGFLKCIAQEWDDVLVRAVDLDLDLPTDELADLLLAELADPDGPSEVGVSRGRRVTWQPVQAALSPSEVDHLELEKGSLVLITGGARGITAKVAVALAKRFQPHIVLVGRTPLPAASEAADVAGLTDPAAIKKALIERLRAAGETAAPAAVELVYRKLLAEREVRSALNEIASAGATWEYHAIDVRDSEAFGRLLDDLNQRGGVQGVIHGAGVIEDRLLRDKTPESFDRVFHTKVDSAFTLARRLDPAKLRFCVLFASLASRYGNRGQSDYAAANEVLSKLAVELDRKWPGRVCSIAWGPWSGVGMVAELEPHLRRRGLKLIEPDEGPQFVLDEIGIGGKGECEVIVAGGAERLVQTKLAPAAEAR